jgi:hypothetical protein
MTARRISTAPLPSRLPVIRPARRPRAATLVARLKAAARPQKKGRP